MRNSSSPRKADQLRISNDFRRNDFEGTGNMTARATRNNGRHL